MSIKRIHREIADLKKEDLGDIVITPDEKDVHVWRASLPGPQGSPYEGGVFNVEIRLASDYPFSAPKMVFTTRIYHMNISERGNICIDILKHNWSPALSIFKVLLSLSSLLTDPNPQDPLVPSIATQYVKNRKLHDTTAKQWVELYARPKKPLPPQPQASTSTSEGVVEGSSSSGRATRGKRKAAGDGNGMPENGAGGSGNGRGPTRSRNVDVDEPIVIEDSDDEVEALGAAAPSSKRRKGGGGGDHASSTGTGTSRSGTSTRASTSARSRPREQLGDVIVIDDD
ncbi:hypothetical protein ONZ45_g18510 [Pleurotus djamor]|nr:hypothetical protein ONZ45_g18510 [Pleurotus djamor]